MQGTINLNMNAGETKNDYRWRLLALSFQALAFVLLVLGLVGQIRPADSLQMLNIAGPEGIFVLVALLSLIVLKRRPVTILLPLYGMLIVSLASTCHVQAGGGIIGWVMLVLPGAALVILAAQFLVLRIAGQRFFWLFFLLNGLAVSWVYIDRLIYTVGKTHLSLNHLAQVMQVTAELQEALTFAGKGNALFLVEMALFVLASLPAALLLVRIMPAPAKVGVRSLLIQVLVASAVFSTILLRFDLACAGLPVYEYLPLRLDLGILPVPDHPALRTSPELNGLLQQNIEIDPDRMYPKNSFELLQRFSAPNLVMISVESLRRAEFETLMKATSAYASRGLWLRDHYAVSNISLSSFNSIFCSSFPFNLAFSSRRGQGIPFQKFLTGQGYDALLVTPEETVMQMENFWGERHIRVNAGEKWQTTPAVLDKVSEILAQPGKKAIHAYLYNLHFNYYFPDSAASYTPVIAADTNLFLMEPDPENLRGLYNRYANAALYADSVIGAFLKKAEADGRFADTLFVIFGDHGESLGEAGFIAHATGPHIRQFAVPTFMIGAGVIPRSFAGPTTHADLIPVISELMGIRASGTFGRTLSDTAEFPLLQLDESVTGRIIVRHRDYMSIFDLADAGHLKWLATVSNEFSIDASVARLYASAGFAELAEVIRADADFVKKCIARGTSPAK